MKSSGPALVLIAHGSRSTEWNARVCELTANVASNPSVQEAFPGGVATAFLEGHQFPIAPTIHNLLARGASKVVAIPVFLTASAHLEDDIPVILGLKHDDNLLSLLLSENVPVLQQGLPVILAPPMAASTVLPRNVARRAAQLLTPRPDSGVVLVYYGSSHYADRWQSLLETVGVHLISQGFGFWDHGAVGHVVQMSPMPVYLAIRRLLHLCQNVAVVPLLVSSSGFQNQIIPESIRRLDLADQARVCYVPDAILPDPEIQDWVVDVALHTLQVSDRSGV